MKPAKKRVFVVDDHPMIREGTAKVINQEPDLTLCGAVATAAEALGGIPRAKPDVVVVDLSLGGRSGLELLKSLRANFPKLPVVIYTMHEEALYAERARADGANAYVTKQQPTMVLLKALRQAVHGTAATRPRTKVSEAVASLLLGKLTDRELEVFELRGQGLTGDHIAARLYLSRKTVDTHLEHIKHKLGLANSAAVLQRAVEWMQNRNSL
ncbi:MAG: DNA-binding transcriptional activator DevR/DosR [Verrucomicrobiae bacterium]|nr:DNA-binding transcriptional activator DevR/DosR [Verrucomicrobiae bacterium]